jgi:hypothetical protein
MASIVPVKKEQCKKLKVSKKRNLMHIANQHILPIHINEYRQAATSFPILLVKRPESSHYRSVAILGIQAGENLYLTDEEWKAIYVPQSASMVPFSLGLDSEKENTLTTCIDIDSVLVGESKDNALFDTNNNETEYLKNIRESLGALYDNEVLTEGFIKELISNDLLIELELVMTFSNDENKKLVGLFGINDKKLHQLDESKILDFHKRGLLSAIHAMMRSLNQIQYLAKLHNNDSKKSTLTQIKFIAADS